MLNELKRFVIRQLYTYEITGSYWRSEDWIKSKKWIIICPKCKNLDSRGFRHRNKMMCTECFYEYYYNDQ